VKDEVVILTGASRGIGRGLALHLARAGASLVVTGRKPDRLAEVSAELDGLGAPHIAVPVDQGDRDGAFALAERTVAEFGRIDGLVANAQTFRSVTPLEDVTPSDMDLLLDTGPKGVLWMMQAVFPAMRDQGRGRIVTLGSNAALLGAAGYGPYVAAKEAIRGLTRVAAREWGQARHRGQLRLPGLGRAPRPTGRRPPPPGRVRRRLQGQPSGPRRRRRGRHRPGHRVPALRRLPLRDGPDLHDRRRRHHAHLARALHLIYDERPPEG
jgi:NAD(P)-dependent dehydrogenase (short-subunit alcohol dehydrogenase family)